MSKIEAVYDKFKIQIADGHEGELYVEREQNEDYVNISTDQPLAVTLKDFRKIASMVDEYMVGLGLED
jgi:hypothetical protein